MSFATRSLGLPNKRSAGGLGRGAGRRLGRGLGYASTNQQAIADQEVRADSNQGDIESEITNLNSKIENLTKQVSSIAEKLSK